MKFSLITGHENVKNILKRAVQTKNIGHAYIFEGPEGVGRYSAAISFASAILCPETENGDSCGVCNVCKMCEAMSHPDVRIITNGLYDNTKKSEMLLTDTIRNMKLEIYEKPYISDRKIYIIPNADSMNVSAQNSLLKILEEPPEYCTIILIAKNANVFLETVLSRAVRIRFSPLDEEVVRDYLVKNKSINPETALSAASMSGGSIGQAIKIAEDEEALKLRDEVIEKLVKMLSPSYKNVFGLQKFLRDNKKDRKEIFSVMDIFFRDIMKISEFKDEESVLMKDKLNELKTFAAKLYEGDATELTDILIKARLGIEQNVNYSATVLMTAMDFWEVIHDRSNRGKI